MGIKAKFNVVILAVYLLGLGLSTVGFNWFLKRHAVSDVEQQARLMIDEASAVRGYTVAHIAPILTAQSSVRFMPQSIPFFAAQTVFHHLPSSYQDYAYKEAALDPTNRADKATDWQADIINTFRHNPHQDELITQRDTAAGPILIAARPIRVDSKDCLTCHSTPQAAPASMIDLYGSAGGFGWHLGEVVGAQIVSAPMSLASAEARHLSLVFIGGLSAIFLVKLVLVNVLLHFLILRPVRQISVAANEVSLGSLDVAEYQRRGRDEMASLAQSFNRMRRSIVHALQMLEEVDGTSALKVREKTKELTQPSDRFR